MYQCNFGKRDALATSARLSVWPSILCVSLDTSRRLNVSPQAHLDLHTHTHTHTLCLSLARPFHFHLFSHGHHGHHHHLPPPPPPLTNIGGTSAVELGAKVHLKQQTAPEEITLNDTGRANEIEVKLAAVGPPKWKPAGIRASARWAERQDCGLVALTFARSRADQLTAHTHTSLPKSAGWTRSAPSQAERALKPDRQVRPPPPLLLSRLLTPQSQPSFRALSDRPRRRLHFNCATSSAPVERSSLSLRPGVAFVGPCRWQHRRRSGA